MPMIRQAMTSRFRQCGVAAVVFLAIFAVIMLGVLTTALGSRSVQNEYDAKTFPVLAAAKDALIAYAAGHPNVPGRLPCADIDNDGVEDCALAGDQLGRLPWKTLGISPLRDASGECLWYAVSGTFRESPLFTPINSDKDGQFNIMTDTTTTVASGVIAVVIAPGPPLDAADRGPSPAPPFHCGGNAIATNYLDKLDATHTNAGIGPNFIAGAPSDTFNDRLVYITPTEFFPRVEKRVAAEIKKALQDYHAATGTYPFANDFTAPYDCTPSTLRGLLPGLACAAPLNWLPSWLVADQWNTITYYAVDPAGAITVQNTPAPNNNKEVVIVMSGRKIAPLQMARPCLVITDCLEGPVNTSGTNTFESKPASPAFNDIVVVVAP